MVVAAATITITETQVCFSEPSLNLQVFLQTEVRPSPHWSNSLFLAFTSTILLCTWCCQQLSQCIIGATSVEDYPAQMTMYIGCATPFVLASYLSNLVWILHCDDPGALHLFNIPVGRTGHFMFYIPWYHRFEEEEELVLSMTRNLYSSQLKTMFLLISQHLKKAGALCRTQKCVKNLTLIRMWNMCVLH